MTVGLLLVATAAALLILFSPFVRNSRAWRATATPLASIVGSGFLVIAPVLGHTFGARAVFAILVIVAVAYCLGAVMRYNIRHAEPLLEQNPPRHIRLVESTSKLALIFAYVISVSFYLQLLSSFLLRGAGTEDEWVANVITTAILVFIAVAGWTRGLHALEFLEEYAVAIKLAVIAGLLAALSSHDFGLSRDGKDLLPDTLPLTFDSLRVLMGTLIVVQGFETSRFLGSAYDADLRIKTMKRAQLMAAAIYVAFIALVTPLLSDVTELKDTAIIDIGRDVTPILGPMLIAAAIMSQFSAGVADTIGGGGLLSEVGRQRLSERRGYIILLVVAIAVTWLTDVFGVINLASRAFAAYYMLQTVEAFAVEMHAEAGGRKRPAILMALAVLAALLLAIVILGKPAG